MKRIGIITLNGNFNYGNRLQNYALQEVLKSFGFSVETILFEHKEEVIHRKKTIRKGNYDSKVLKKIAGMTFLDIVKKIIHKLWYEMHKKKVKKLGLERYCKFADFTKKYIIETDFVIEDNNIPMNFHKRYQYLVIGSDQVWNPYYLNHSSINFLTFAPKSKRIAYSPSFGVSKIPDKYVKRYQIWISEMTGLSVREEEGARIIRKLTGKEVTVLVDPTVLLTKDKWLSIAKSAVNKPKGPYLLTYFLGVQTKETKKLIKNIAKIHKLKDSPVIKYL